MKKILFLIGLLCSINIYSQGLEKYQAVRTTQTGGRYEIVQSEISRRLTFKVDKYKGSVYQLVRTINEKSQWQEILKEPAMLDTVIPGQINYQLFFGGIAASDSFLLNINTGTTWKLVEGSKGILLLEVFE
jgi:hypothetical protein